MVPYHASSLDSQTTSCGSGKNISSGKTNSEDVIFSLTERLREREAEIRLLRKEKSELENQLIHRGNPIKLDDAYEELLSHLKQREDHFRSELKQQDVRHREIERENRKLKERVHTSRKLLDEKEKNISVIEKEADDELDMMRERLNVIKGENNEKDRQIEMLEGVTRMQEGRQLELERENYKLKEKIQASRALLDEQEKNMATIEKEADDDLDMMGQKLDNLMGEDQEKDRQIAMLEGMVDNLTLKIEHSREKEDEDQALLARLGERMDNYRRDWHELEEANEKLQKQIEAQHLLLTEKDDEIQQIEKYRDERENELNDDLDKMSVRYVDIIDTYQDALVEREEEIHLLYRQCAKYEDVIDEADHATHEQRADLKAKKKEIEELSTKIERSQNSGLLSQLDKMFRCNTDGSGNGK